MHGGIQKPRENYCVSRGEEKMQGSKHAQEGLLLDTDLQFHFGSADGDTNNTVEENSAETMTGGNSKAESELSGNMF